MKCDKVRKKLLIFLDGELPEKQKVEIQNHLNGCPGCLKQVEVLLKIWDVAEGLERIEPSPYLWNKLSLRVVEYESSQNLFSAFFRTISRYTVPATVVVIFLIGILAGIYLGSSTNFQKIKTSNISSVATAREKFVRSSYLDIFDDMPAESIGGIYIALVSDKE